MEITEVRTHIIKVPLEVPHEYAAKDVRAKRGTLITHIIVEIITNEEITGLGEVTPAVVIDGQPREAVVAAINNHLGPLIIGEDPFNLEKISEKWDGRVFGNNYAKAAVNIALFDAMGKKAEIPVFKLLGGKYREKVPLMYDVSEVDVTKVVKKTYDQGFRAFKIKVGKNRDPKEDVKRIAAAREAAGDDADIWPDINEAYPPKECIKVIKHMEKYNILCAEQPLSVHDLIGAAKLVAAVDTPIAPDEAICSPEDFIKHLVFKAADMIVIKIEESGGLDKARLIAKMAEAANMPCLMASCLPLGIGLAAGAHLATATKNISYCELGWPYRDDVINTDFEWYKCRQKGYIMAPTAPGLGVEIDEDKFEKYKVKSFSTRQKEAQVPLQIGEFYY